MISIHEAEATRMAEGSIFIDLHIQKSLNAAKIDATTQVSGDQLIVTVHEHRPQGIVAQHTGIGHIQFKVWEKDVDIASIAYIDVYAGEDSRRITLS